MSRFPHPDDVVAGIAAALPPLSHLECMTCGRKKPVGSVGGRLVNGWPKCCGYTMRLFTVREMEAKEADHA